MNTKWTGRGVLMSLLVAAAACASDGASSADSAGVGEGTTSSTLTTASTTTAASAECPCKWVPDPAATRALVLECTIGLTTFQFDSSGVGEGRQTLRARLADVRATGATGRPAGRSR